jgi:MFS family permease
MFLFGYGFGSLICGPFSETFGRNPVYIASLVAFIIAVAVAGFSRDLATQIIFRFIAGCAGSSPIVCAGGSFSDLWTSRQLIYVLPIFAVTTFMGSTLGPPVGGFLVQDGSSWRWVDWTTAIIAGALLLVVVFCLPETFRPILFQLKVTDIRKVSMSDGDWNLSQQEERPPSSSKLLETIKRPFILTGREPTIILFALYLSIIYVILFTSLNGFTFVYGDTYGFGQGSTGLCFLGMLVGNCLVLPTVPVTYRLYCRDLHRAQRELEGLPQ